MNDKQIDVLTKIVLIPTIIMTVFLGGTILIDYLETVQIPEFIDLSTLLSYSILGLVLFYAYLIYKKDYF